jgi:hypothetical protein
MALVVKDRVRETSTSTGTANVILSGAVQAFQDFSVIGDGNTTYYAIVDATTGDWEVGIGTYTLATTTLTRNTILESSDGGTAVNFAANVKDVFVTYPAERSVYTNGSDIVPATASRLGFANLTQGSALSVLGVTGNSTADVASIAAAGDHEVLRRNGTSVGFGAVALNQSAAVSGQLPVASGGTGAATLTGYVKGAGTSALTASATIPNGDITGLGTMSTQNSTNISVTGGSINGTTVGATTASTGAFTDLAGSNVSLTGGAINGTTVGATTTSTGAFTDFSASGTASFTSTGSVKIPVGTTAQRPSPVAGMLRFNDDLDEFEGYNGTAWASVGGSAISNDTTTATDLFPSFLNATTGTAASIFTSNAKLLYKPSTGEFKSQQLVATNGIVVNSATVSASYTIPTGSNAMSAGAVSIADGVTVTVSDGSNWVIV